VVSSGLQVDQERGIAMIPSSTVLQFLSPTLPSHSQTKQSEKWQTACIRVPGLEIAQGLSAPLNIWVLFSPMKMRSRILAGSWGGSVVDRIGTGDPAPPATANVARRFATLYTQSHCTSGIYRAQCRRSLAGFPSKDRTRGKSASSRVIPVKKSFIVTRDGRKRDDYE